MGVVYAAYDPDLDRKVAVKLLHPNLAGSDHEELARTRLLREAQALARLSHHNVVAVYDVGTHGDHVFIAMEFIRGVSLKQWLADKPRDVRDIVAVFIEAGRGLAAAHRAGLVHGDFKPDNVLIDIHGHAKVVDFGLAFAQDHDSTVDRPAAEQPSDRMIRGTPAYLSPEQIRGERGSALADQFSFSVSLFEALHGERPFTGDDLPTLARAIVHGPPPTEAKTLRFPTWLRRIVARGLQRDPGKRFPDMPALIAALARDPSVRRKRWLLGLASATLVIASAAGYRWALLQAYAANQGLCAGAAEKLDGVWDPSRKAAMRAALQATGVTYATETADHLDVELDRIAKAWVQMHTQACEATHVRGEQSPALLDRRMACLNHRLVEVRTLVDVLLDADATTVELASEAVAKLSPLEPCADTTTTAIPAATPSPAQAAAVAEVEDLLAQFRALTLIARFDQAHALADAAVASARLLDDRSVLAGALFEQAKLQRHAGHTQAEDNMLAAFYAAVATDHTSRSTDAAIELGHLALERGDPARCGLWLGLAEALLERLRATGAALLGPLTGEWLNVRGTMHVHMDMLEQAEADYRQAIASAETNKTGVIEIAGLYNNLGNVLVRRGAVADAQQTLKRAAALYRNSHGPHHPSHGIALNNLGELARLRGDLTGAESIYREAYAILLAALGSEHPNVGISANNLGEVALLRGDAAAAVKHYTQAEAIFRKAFGDPSPPLAYPWTGLGEAALLRGDPDAAIRHLQAALAQRAGHDDPELARTRFALARALADRDPATAHDLATAAATLYRTVPTTHARELAEVETWLQTPPKPRAQ